MYTEATYSEFEMMDKLFKGDTIASCHEIRILYGGSKYKAAQNQTKCNVDGKNERYLSSHNHNHDNLQNLCGKASNTLELFRPWSSRVPNRKIQVPYQINGRFSGR